MWDLETLKQENEAEVWYRFVGNEPGGIVREDYGILDAVKVRRNHRLALDARVLVNTPWPCLK